MQIRHTPNGLINKIVVFLALLLVGYAIVVFATSCNSTHRTQSKESAIQHHDSAGKYEESHLIIIDSTQVKEDNSLHYHTGDSSLDAEMEIVMQQQKDYANYDTGSHFPPRPVYTPVIIERSGDRVTVDAGGREIQSISLKDRKQGSKKDSVVLEASLKTNVGKTDSSAQIQSSAVIDSSDVKKQLKKVDRKKTPWYLYVIAGLTLAFVVAIVLYIKKPSVIQQIAAKLPDPPGINKEA